MKKLFYVLVIIICSFISFNIGKDMGFNLGNKLSVVQNGNLFSAVFTLDENQWNGMVSLQLKVKDLR